MRNLLTFYTVALAAILLVLGLSIAGYGGSGAPPKGPNDNHRVTIENFTFTPAALPVPVGATVTWVNRDDTPHTVVSTENKFKSQTLDTDGEFSYKFTGPGTYEYFCSVHPKMTGKVVVQ
jgi:plastocyanin